jgi:4-amino-4-deoxy-L-arabinose transferase-like glycosyltransferase
MKVGPGWKTVRWDLAVLLMLALGARLYGIDWGLPDFNEEAYPFRKAWEMWGWGSARGFSLNPHFFKYPSLTIYLQLATQALLFVAMRAAGAIRNALDFRVLYETNPSALVIGGRVVTAVLGALTVVPCFELGRIAAGPAAGWVAAALVAVAPSLLTKSQMIEVDVPLVFFVACALWKAAEMIEAPTRRAAAWTGVWIGLAASCKYPGALALGAAWWALALARPRLAPRPASAAPGDSARAAKRVTSAGTRLGGSRLAPRGRVRAPSRLALAALTTLLAVASLCLTSPYVILDLHAFLSDLAAERQHMAMGHFGEAGGAAWLEYARLWFTSLFGVTIGAAAVAGLAFFAASRRERWALMLGGFVALYFVVVGSWTMKADRYLLPLFPAGAVFAAAAATALVHRFARGRRVPSVIAAVALGLVLLVPLAPMAREHLARRAPDPRTEARAWIEARVPYGSLVASEEYGPGLRGPNSLRALDPELRTALRARGAPLYATLEIPFTQVGPERSEPIYDLDLFRDVDWLIVSASVADRYRAEPERFAGQVAFYDSLERRFVRRAVFRPRGAIGSTITLYSNPAEAVPFGRRATASYLAPARASRDLTLGFFFFNRGVNAEAFGFDDQAVEGYRLALRQGEPSRADVQLTLVRIGHCLLEAGLPHARAYLDTAAVAAPDALERAALAALGQELARNPAPFRADSLVRLRR